jgi:hypothetical protein
MQSGEEHTNDDCGLIALIANDAMICWKYVKTALFKISVQ